ncbi:MAG: hypothetical protein ACLR7Z_17165 [Bilophila wadsworthia]
MVKVAGWIDAAIANAGNETRLAEINEKWPCSRAVPAVRLKTCRALPRTRRAASSGPARE